MNSEKSAQAGAQAGAQAETQDTAQTNMSEDAETKKILEYCKTPKSRSEIQEYMGYNSREYFRRCVLNPLIKGGLLKLTIPDKLTSPNQKYYSER